MRIYREDLGSEARIAYGQELIIGLSVKPETAPLADAMRPVQDVLAMRFTERKLAAETQTRVRVSLRFADHELDSAIRGVRRATETLDGNRVGPLSLAVFPDGVVAETVPVGERQEKRARALLARVNELTLAGADALRAQVGAAISTAVAQFVEARASYEDASEAVATAFARETRARDAHRLQLKRVAFEVSRLYPDDRVKRDLFFPEVKRYEGGEEDETPET